MKYLLDTHTFLFTLFDSPELSAKARQAITEPDNEIHVSTVTFWEISLKFSIHKLDLAGCKPEEFPALCTDMGFSIIELKAEESASFHLLPHTSHKDPFDRMLIWQALRQNLVIISRDSHFMDYCKAGLRVLW